MSSPIAVHRNANWRSLLVATCLLALAGCGHVTLVAPPAGTLPNAVVLPLVSGWYEGEVVHYVSTDVSTRDMARLKGANYAPRLAAAVPARTPGAATTSVLERIYAFAPGTQGSVLPSMPRPTGFESRDEAYSPLWRIVKVQWQPGRPPRTLRSEEEVLAAAERGEVALEETSIVVNCPVVHSASGGTLRGARLGYLPPTN